MGQEPPAGGRATGLHSHLRGSPPATIARPVSPRSSCPLRCSRQGILRSRRVYCSAQAHEENDLTLRSAFQALVRNGAAVAGNELRRRRRRSLRRRLPISSAVRWLCLLPSSATSG